MIAICLNTSNVMVQPADKLNEEFPKECLNTSNVMVQLMWHGKIRIG